MSVARSCSRSDSGPGPRSWSRRERAGGRRCGRAATRRGLPHLDDAVLSYGGHVLAAVAAGRAVRVVTVFSAAPDPAWEARRAEDRAAVTALGAEPVHLELLDAPFRSARYAGSAGLLLGPVDEATVAKVAEALVALGGELVGPLAVGHHVDHRVVHRAVTAAAERNRRVARFYEDRPYAQIRHAVAARLRALGWRVDLPFGRLAHARSFHRAPWVRAWVDPQTQARCVLAAGDRAPVRGEAVAETRAFDGAVVERLAEAVACYGSQIGPLYGGIRDWRVATAAYARTLAGAGAVHAERTWSLAARTTSAATTRRCPGTCPPPLGTGS